MHTANKTGSLFLDTKGLCELVSTCYSCTHPYHVQPDLNSCVDQLLKFPTVQEDC